MENKEFKNGVGRGVEPGSKCWFLIPFIPRSSYPISSNTINTTCLAVGIEVGVETGDAEATKFVQLNIDESTRAAHIDRRRMLRLC